VVAISFHHGNRRGIREFLAMIGKAFILSSLIGAMSAICIFAAPAYAAVTRDGATTFHASGEETEPALVRLAQSRDLEVYYDQYGRRVLVDPDTGQVVTVLPDRRDGDGYAPRWRDRYSGDNDYGRDRYDDGYGYDDGYAAPDDDGQYRYERQRQMRERRDRALRQRELRQQRAIGSDQDSDANGPARDGGGDSALGNNRFPDVETYPRPNAAQNPGTIEQSPLPPPGGRGDEQASLGEPRPLSPQAAQPPVTAPRINGAPFVESAPALGPIVSTAAVAQLQIVLDRAGASPGVIDGHFGDNARKALAAYKEITGKALDINDPKAMKAVLERTGGPAFTTYTITDKDAAGPYVASIPVDYGKKAKLERLGYSSVAEMLAERFHMDEDYLKQLNPGANFNRPGTIIKVAATGKPVTTKVARIVADKGREEVYAYDAGGKLVAAYPATIGSTDTPSPSGTVKVERVVFSPTYTYNPKINFKQGNNDHVLTIPPGPNNPVGDVWIALSKPTYGIHGTPDPSKIGKTSSHGCVRLTNWDAEEVARLVSPGVWVQCIH
jgi:lipoprotein-anchoring transpeptidase ErfK/SrfK